ncbi:hypothetical protein CJU90_0132 [Yarrowia sp. C11]|nr:hypothetical protein CKK34_1543 [Yarrowia sp. E02]KAG5372493.1 hypothetical protein CJU90_0132 [Yarrowia sp. C11]
MNQAPLNPSSGNSGNMMQRQLHKKLFQQKSFASPTDNLMSPCSAKLRAHKNKYISINNKAKPGMSFNARLQKSMSEESDCDEKENQ